jgi:YfiH family protein
MNVEWKFFTRQGGVSKGIYQSLNCGPGSDDNPQAVEENLRRASGELGVLESRLMLLHQVHSPTCLVVHEPWTNNERPQADAIVTDKHELAVGVLTADCTPVLFKSTKGDGAPIVGAAHAGWKGALGGVLDSTVEAITKLGGSEIEAMIGPCIGQASYEVQEQFAEPFFKRDDEADKFFMSGQREGHLQFDIAGYCAFRLAQAGIKNVDILDHDTYAMEESYFSYRRTTHREENDYGRQLSAIVIRS